MNYNDIGYLLGRVKNQDNREVPKSGTLHEEWLQILTDVKGMDDPTLEECVAALLTHRQEKPGVYLEAGHLLANVRRIRLDREREDRITVARRGEIRAPVITLDRAQFEADTQAAIREHRVRRGMDPLTGKPAEVNS